LRSAQSDIAQLQESLDEEQESKAAVQKQLAAAKSEANTWKAKYEGEAVPKIEELEESK
jgi:septal ring factor EnvC (AmiA/AmiB activator)